MLPFGHNFRDTTAWAKDLKGLEGHDFAVIGAGNRPPEVQGELFG